MKTRTMWLVALLLGACGQGSSNVYEQPLPASGDMDALMDIKEEVKPEDADTWQSLTRLIMSPKAKRPTSKTVGEAITAYRARRACMDANEPSKLPLGPNDTFAKDYEARRKAHTEALKNAANAYNACLKMPV